MERDVRILDHRRLIQQKENQLFLKVLSRHPFENNEKIVEWLHNQVLAKTFTEPNTTKVPFEMAIAQSNISNDLKTADLHYVRIFRFENLIGDQVKDLEISDPFSNVINRIYNKIWEIGTSVKGEGLYVYSYLEDHLGALLGQSIGADVSIDDFRKWYAIYQTAFQIQSFYGPWISSIPTILIETRVDELAVSFLGDSIPKNILRMSYRTPEGYHNLLKENSNRSDWDCVDNTTWESDLIDLDESIELKGQLLLRCGTKQWLRWWDNLKWPIVQDNVLHLKDNFRFYDELMDAVLDETVQLVTKREHLLLMVLKHYFYLCTRVTENLGRLEKGKWHTFNSDYQNEIIAQAKKQNASWVEELPEISRALYHRIFGPHPVSQSRYFIGVWQWVTSYSRLTSVHRDSTCELFVLDAFQDAFNTVLVSDAANKITHITLLDRRFVNWENLKSLIILFEQDKNDQAFRDALITKYIEFVRNDKFLWNSQKVFNAEAINQAFYFACLIYELEVPLRRWEELYNEFKYWHEGWMVSRNFEATRSKELYILLVGISLSYLYFQRDRPEQGNLILQKVSGITFNQCRVSFSSTNDYILAIRFISHVNVQFRLNEIDHFIEFMNMKIDNIKMILEALYEISLTLKSKSMNWSAQSFEIIERRIRNHFRYIEMKYNQLEMKNQLEYFQKIRQEVLSLKINPM